MTKQYCFLIFVLASLLCCSCRQRVIPSEKPPHWFEHYTAFHKKAYQEHFSSSIDSLPDTLDWRTALVKQYYQENTHEPYWTYRGIQEGRIDTLLHYLALSYEHGIPDTFFHLPDLTHTMELLRKHQVKNDSSLYDTLTKLEFALTKAYLSYVEALTFGATDPLIANGGKWMMTTLQSDSDFVSTTLAKMKQLPATLRECQPQDSNYLALQSEMRRLHPLTDSTWTPIEEQVVFKGEHSPTLANVCKRLQLTGELPNHVSNNTLDDKLLSAINLFRRNNAIPESDSLDLETIRKLNRPISYYVEKIAVNLERLRWQVTPQKDKQFIAVNIPDFTMKTYVDGAMVFQTRICCGRTQNPKADPTRVKNGLVKAFKAESPLLYSEIKRIILNPEWSIPYDIIKDEYYYKLCRSNTAVVNREKLFIKDIRNGRQIIPDSINWNEVSQNNIPYRLYQSSGRHNALGQIKFDFANSQSVYLHDTNNKGAFKRRSRALSHGCIRVENPFDLANILYELNEFDSTRIEQLGILVGNKPTTEEGEKYLEELHKRDSIQESKLTDEQRLFYRKLKPTGIALKNRMPLYIEYWTCFVGDNGQIQYREDIYYKDGNISTLLRMR